jgi:hypothetical protein
VPKSKYSNLSIRQEVRQLLDELRNELGINDLNDLLILLVRTYKEHTNIVSKIEEVVTNTVSKVVKEILSGHTNSVSKRKKSAMDVLREQGFIDERELYGKVRDPDRLILSLEKQGGKVFEVKGSRIIVDPEFFNLLMKKLESVNTSKESELKKLLNEREYKLLELLREGGYIFFDAVEKKWKLVED